MNYKQHALDSIKHAQGMIGETTIREWLKHKGIQHAQVDLIIKHQEKWGLLEIKNQERFLAPPYDGHGLPIWQFKARLDFYQSTGVIPWLFIIEPHDLKIAYVASMVELAKLPEENRQITSKTKRIIFPIDAFKVIHLTH